MSNVAGIIVGVIVGISSGIFVLLSIYKSFIIVRLVRCVVAQSVIRGSFPF